MKMAYFSHDAAEFIHSWLSDYAFDSIYFVLFLFLFIIIRSLFLLHDVRVC